ncbi:A1AG2 protein, partial [Onychorhynchus coronatus]|nr:A1AG2 protein [Onychorhynchus coronatus]
LTLLLGLTLALSAEHPSCAPLVPITFDNTTIPRILGQWFYIVGASRYPPHLAELKEIKFAAFSFFPGSHEDELNVTEIIRLNETCVARNSSKIQVSQQNSTLVHVDDNQVASTARLIQSDKDLLILNHINIDFPSLSLSARTPNVSKEHMEEFKAHLHCLGFTEEDMFYAS